MAIETLDDILEDLADQCDVYGAHGDEDVPGDVTCTPQNPCRMCWMSDLQLRIEQALAVEKRLAGAV